MKTVRTTLLAAAAAAFALGATFAYAQESGPQVFEQWDADKDGTITLAEVESRRSDIFASFDANEDGFFTEEEAKLMDEMRDNQQEMNKENGAMQGMGQGQGMGQHKGMGGGMGQGQGQGMGQGQGKGKGMGMDTDPGHGPRGHMGFDADNDGKVSKDEFIGQSKEWLAKFDRNGDGNVNKADFGL